MEEHLNVLGARIERVREESGVKSSGTAAGAGAAGESTAVAAEA
jgi:hypothetical protein